MQYLDRSLEVEMALGLRSPEGSHPKAMATTFNGLKRKVVPGDWGLFPPKKPS